MPSLIQTEIKESLRLTIPLASAQVAQAATGFVDTVMMGWLGQETIAAGGLAATTFTTLLITTTGVVVGLSPLIAEAYGSGYNKRIQQLTRQGIWLSLLVAIPVMLLLGHIDYLMRHLGQAATTITLAKTYLDVMLWGFFPALMFAMLKSVVSSLSQTRPVIVIVVAGTAFNAIANYILGFGKLGFTAWGLKGIALASALSQWLMLLLLIIYILKHSQLRSYKLFANLYHLEPKILRELLWIGVPIAISFAFEVGLFTVTTYLMGVLGTDVLAAHQIVFQTIALIFMVPLGMSFATTIRVGQWNGQQNSKGVRRAAYISICLGAMFMTIMAIALLIFPRQVIALYLDVDNPENARVISLATSMLTIAALSQILDGVQTTAAGALRGLKDTRVPMLLSFLAFWGVGLTSGYLLGFKLGFSGVGLWLGQLLGVAVSAGVFVWRFRRLMSEYVYQSP
ncbi:MAG: MATE family efflux transporter [Gloeocapsa sp. UFS-A4-WI-NPMV-4B04]|jgi:MATE family multidrug resistance protein|nr:MATE family efflux transporter [Gloeocapsa sp. UFS-A4-WI-NPMV-4B04]